MRHAGGKGINVAACLADWGAARSPRRACWGRPTTPPFRALFVARGIDDRCVRIPGETRTNIKLAGPQQRRRRPTSTCPALAPSPEALDAALRRAACGDRGRAASPCSPAACRPACRPRLYAELVALLPDAGRARGGGCQRRGAVRRAGGAGAAARGQAEPVRAGSLGRAARCPTAPRCWPRRAGWWRAASRWSRSRSAPRARCSSPPRPR